MYTHTHTLYICGVVHTYCIWTYVDAHTDMHIHAHAHTCIQACMHMYTHAQTHTHTHIHREPHTHAFSSPMSHINPLVYMTVKWILDFTHTHTHTHTCSLFRYPHPHSLLTTRGLCRRFQARSSWHFPPPANFTSWALIVCSP